MLHHARSNADLRQRHATAHVPSKTDTAQVPFRNDKCSAEPRDRINDGIQASDKNPNGRAFYEKAYAKELGRLAQGMPGLFGGTETIFFINKGEVPPDRW